MSSRPRRVGAAERFGLRLALLLAAALAAAACIGCSGGQPPPDAGAASEEPQAGVGKAVEPTAGGAAQPSGRAVMERMVAAYRGAASYSDRGQMRMSGKLDGQPVDQAAPYRAAFERPGKLRLEVFGGIAVSDGGQLWGFAANLPNQVLRKPTPDPLTPAAVLDDLILAGAMAQGPTQIFSWMPLQAILLLAEDPMKSLLHSAEEPKLLAPESIGQSACYRVEARRPDGAAVFWIDQDSYLLRRLELPTDELSRMFEAGRVQDLALAIELADARIGGPVEPSLFQFQPPPSAEIVEGFQPPGMNLLGKPAPQFAFADLEGKPITPQSLAGKVVVLDFWATWCEPCRQTLPVLQAVYQQFQDDPKVAFLAVSVDQPQVDNATLQGRFRELGLSVPIARDLEQFALESFGISGIPTMVLLGADGTVQGFETGMMQGLDAGLPAVLGELLAGSGIHERKVDNFLQGRARFERWLEQRAEDGFYGGPLSFEQEPARAEIAPQTEPQAFRLKRLWTCKRLSEPGNIVVVEQEGGPPQIVVVDAGRAVARLAADGSVAAMHKLPVTPDQPVRFLRTTIAQGRRLWIGAANGGQQLHVLDAEFQPLATYPQNALENQHDGIGDVQFADLDGDGVPQICVGYWGVVGVQGVSLEGQRVWANRSLANALRLAVLSPAAAGAPPTPSPQQLLSTNQNGTLAILGDGGEKAGELALPNLFLHWIVAEDLDGDGRQELCGLSPTETADFVALGLNLQGELLWTYPLPPGIHQHPIEPVIAGRVFPDGPRHWLIAAADGSIHVLAADGAPLEQFNYGTALTGLATAELGGKPALLVSTADGLDAWQLEPPGP